MSICGMLGLNSSLFKNSWYELEDALGVHIREITEEIVEENVLEELKGKTPMSLGISKLKDRVMLGGRLEENLLTQFKSICAPSPFVHRASMEN